MCWNFREILEICYVVCLSEYSQLSCRTHLQIHYDLGDINIAVSWKVSKQSSIDYRTCIAIFDEFLGKIRYVLGSGENMKVVVHRVSFQMDLLLQYLEIPRIFWEFRMGICHNEFWIFNENSVFHKITLFFIIVVVFWSLVSWSSCLLEHYENPNCELVKNPSPVSEW